MAARGVTDRVFRTLYNEPELTPEMLRGLQADIAAARANPGLSDRERMGLTSASLTVMQFGAQYNLLDPSLDAAALISSIAFSGGGTGPMRLRSMSEPEGFAPSRRSTHHGFSARTVVNVEAIDDFRTVSRNPSANATYRYDGFEFETDALGRGTVSRGQLQPGAGGNRFYDDRKIGYPHNPDAVQGDIGFHAIGDQFGAPGGKLNLFPGNKELNNTSKAADTFGNLERHLRSIADQGQRVDVEVARVFGPENMSARPDKIVVRYTIDAGVPVQRTFNNRKPGG
jgi:hypothetical protein